MYLSYWAEKIDTEKEDDDFLLSFLGCKEVKFRGICPEISIPPPPLSSLPSFKKKLSEWRSGNLALSTA
jgi:hypothetical protein